MACLGMICAVAAPSRAQQQQQQQQQTAPSTSQTSATAATAATGATVLVILVTAVQGGAQYRPEGEKKWVAVRAGQQLAEGVELRTGPKGAIQFKVFPDQVYRVDRLTAVKVLRANLLSDGTIKTDVGMTYGRVSKDLDAPARPHDDTVVSPSSTLAVRGTRVSVYDQPPYTPEAVSLTGRAVYQVNRRQPVAFGAKGEGTARVTADTPDAAATKYQATLIDPRGAFAGRSPTEQQLLLTLNAYAGRDISDTGVFAFLRAEATRAAIARRISLVGALPILGQVNVALQWTGAPGTLVDLTVISPKDETVNMTARSVPSGGQYTGGAPIPTGGRTSNAAVTWARSFPAGTYQYHADLVAGSSASVQILISQDPQLPTGTTLGFNAAALGPTRKSVGGSFTPTKR